MTTRWRTLCDEWQRVDASVGDCALGRIAVMETYYQDVRDAFGLTLGGMALDDAAAFLGVDECDVQSIANRQFISEEPSPATIAERAAEVRQAWSADEFIKRAGADNTVGNYADPYVEIRARHWAEQRAVARRAGRSVV